MRLANMAIARAQFRQSRRDDLTIARSFNCGYLNPKNPSVPTGRLNLADSDGPAVRPYHEIGDIAQSID
jgi:hypothetical protein